jgi:hypothetical protein
MSKEKLDYMAIQTDPSIWTKLLELNPIHPDEVFLEPFSGENSLFDQVDTNNKQWCEITKGRDIFDYDFANSDVTVLYTNPPFKSDIPNKKGIKSYKNCVFFFLEYFMKNLKHLKTIGFLINAKSFCSLTPNRLHKLEQLGFSISNITVLNTTLWYGCYYFILFESRQTNKFIKIIPKTFI